MLLSDQAFQLLAQLLNMIEEGHGWPDTIPTAKAAFLAKDPSKTDDPLSYRVLLILPTLYRRWASVRLLDMAPWIDEWAMDEMYAGVKGQGAQDGWYKMALYIEAWNLTNGKFTGGTVDIWKCLDQIPRNMLYALATKAGMTDGILNAYRCFQEGMDTRTQHDTVRTC